MLQFDQCVKTETSHHIQANELCGGGNRPSLGWAVAMVVTVFFSGKVIETYVCTAIV